MSVVFSVRHLGEILFGSSEVLQSSCYQTFLFFTARFLEPEAEQQLLTVSFFTSQQLADEVISC